MYFSKRNIITDNKIIKLNNKYKQTQDWKPNGIWYSCRNSWYKFIKNEDMYERLYKYIHKIKITNNKLTTIKKKDSEKLLIINNINDFDEFYNEYRILNNKLNYYLIDWKKVSKDYGGIEICPYLHERRKIKWYYTWDVASGCIWNNNIIKNTLITYTKINNKYIKMDKNR
tara:strand:+ start:365 stop:877 length:513 start_codon:yes stop_codon:yes gene_type:complete